MASRRTPEGFAPPVHQEEHRERSTKDWTPIPDDILARYDAEDRQELQLTYDRIMEKSQRRIREMLAVLQLPEGTAATILRQREEEVTEIAETHFRLEKTANRDGLTNLFRRDPFSERFETARERMSGVDMGTHREMAVAFLDLDHLKRANDEFGHHVADLLLKKIGKKMNDITRTEESDAAARFGGDEFALLLTHMGEDMLEPTIQRIYQQLTDIVIVKDKETGHIDVIDSSLLPVETEEKLTGRQKIEQHGRFAVLHDTSFSVGVARMREGEQHLESLEQVLEKTDKAAYYIKHELDRGGIAIIDKIEDGEWMGKTYKYNETQAAFGEATEGINFNQEVVMNERRVAIEVRENLSRTLNCVKARHQGELTPPIQQCLDAISHEVYKECYE